MNALIVATAGLLIAAAVVLAVTIVVVARTGQRGYAGAHARRPAVADRDPDAERYRALLAAAPHLDPTMIMLARVRDKLRDLPAVMS